MKVLTVIAHFDYLGEFSQSFLKQVKYLNEISKYTVVVTCSRITNKESLPEGVVVLERPNYGYDLYSYKVGLEYAFSRSLDFDKLIITNSSYYVINEEIFTLAVKSSLCKCDDFNVVGFVKSLQFEPHIQSWFLVLGKNVLLKDEILDFFKKVKLCKSKQDIIHRYEIGFSSLLSSLGIRIESIYYPQFPHQLLDRNPMFIAYEDVYLKCGVIKAEKLRKLSDLALRRLGIPSIIISDIAKTKKYYLNPPTNLPLEWLEYRRTNHKANIAVILHLFYPDLSIEISEQLRNITMPFDIYITTTNAEYLTRIINAFGQVANKVCVCITENRGRDVLPFLKVLDNVDFINNYEYLLKIHGKKSKYSNRGKLWRNDLFNSLIGSKHIVDTSLKLLNESNIGMVGPHCHYLSDEQYWGANKEQYLKISNLLGIQTRHQKLGFFAGTMFWSKPIIFKKLLGIQNLLYFEDEKGQRDGTVAHALERIFIPLCHSEGFKATSISLEGEDVCMALTNFKLFVAET